MSNDYNIQVGKRIKKSRKKKGISMKVLGEMVNLHESTISRYEKGEIKALDIEKLKEFAKVLDVPTSYLIGWDYVETPTSLQTYNIGFNTGGNSIGYRKNKSPESRLKCKRNMVIETLSKKDVLISLLAMRDYTLTNHDGDYILEHDGESYKIDKTDVDDMINDLLKFVDMLQIKAEYLTLKSKKII